MNFDTEIFGGSTDSDSALAVERGKPHLEIGLYGRRYRKRRTLPPGGARATALEQSLFPP